MPKSSMQIRAYEPATMSTLEKFTTEPKQFYHFPGNHINGGMMVTDYDMGNTRNVTEMRGDDLHKRLRRRGKHSQHDRTLQ